MLWFENPFDRQLFASTNEAWNDRILNSPWSVGRVSEQVKTGAFESKEQWEDAYYESGARRAEAISKLSDADREKVLDFGTSYSDFQAESAELQDLNFRYGRTRQELQEQAEVLRARCRDKRIELSIEEAIQFVRYRTICETWNGYLREREAIRNLSKQFPDLDFRAVDGATDVEFGVDCEVYQNQALKLALQIKPPSYRSNASYLQTAKKAQGYGLPSTTYVKGEFSNDLAAKGDAVCLTTYQALFNGKSRFFNREITGIVFDDAHAAEHLLRDHFSLRVGKDRFERVYSTICNEFADYFHAVGLSSSFEEVVNGTGHRSLLVPPFEVRRVHEAVLKLLQESEVPEDDNTTFAWAHLKDRIDLCAHIISPNGILHLKQGDNFYGTFTGQGIQMDQGSGFHWDGIPWTLCSSLIADAAGAAAGSSTGAVTSSTMA